MDAVQERDTNVARHLFPVAALPADLGRRVAAARRARRWNQDRLARRAGVSRAAIVRVERGGGVRADTVLRIAAALDLEVRELAPAWPEWDVLGPGHGVRTRARRRALGLSLAEVAAAAGVSEATLSRYERGVGASPTLLARAGDDHVAASDALARALGFADAGAHERFCARRD